MKAAFLSVGCKTNQYEIEAFREEAKKVGYEIVSYDQEADVYIINTCIVTKEAARKSKQMIRRAGSDDAHICVMGCYSQLQPDEVKALGNVKIVVGTDNRTEILRYMSNLMNKEKAYPVKNDTADYEDLRVTEFGEKTRAYVKIEDGCDEFCSYCIIPFARGRVRSRHYDEIIKEAVRLAASGYAEVVITGINICKYQFEGKNLLDVIDGINRIDGIERIRLSSIYPDYITKDVLDRMVRAEKLCPQFHVSLQSGSDNVLRDMNRKYTSKEAFMNLLYAQEVFDEMLFTGDVIVGFPGETENDFEATYDFIRALPFYHVHVFKYSPRKGTGAFDMQNQISTNIKKERSRKLIELSFYMKKEIITKSIGKTGLCLFETALDTTEDEYTGRLANYMEVVCRGDSLSRKIIPVKITGHGNNMARAVTI